MGMWSNANEKSDNRTERKARAALKYQAQVERMRTAKGGSTPKPEKREPLTWSEKRAADKDLKSGKSKRGTRW